jgi:hypothetical protein
LFFVQCGYYSGIHMQRPKGPRKCAVSIADVGRDVNILTWFFWSFEEKEKMANFCRLISLTDCLI